MTGLALISSLAEENARQKFKGVSRILGPAWAHLPTLTIGLLGVQVFWSVEMSYASPYLLSLGLSKSSMAVVFLAGPLSGLIMQPLIGVLADNCTSRFGRRRPYMFLGTITCMLAMLLLGFTRPVASIFTGWNNNTNDRMTIWLAVIAIYMIDFSINAVQAVDRALLVDILPPSEQPTGNAWAARMLGVGSVIGFFVGNINLPAIFPFLGKSQLEVLSVVVSLLLLAGHTVMALLVRERVLLKDNSSKAHRKTFTRELKDIWFGMLTLPSVIRRICIIQFFAWLAWFPILFYTTIYIGDLYKRTIFASSGLPSSDEEIAALDAEATRLGSRALFYASLVTLFCNIALPFFVAEAEIIPERRKPAIRSSSTAGGADIIFSGSERTPTFIQRLVSLRAPRKMQVHLGTLWGFSHLILAGCMFGTFLISSAFGATLMITVTGFSWAVSQWVPFSLLGKAILTEPGPAEAMSPISLVNTRGRGSEDAEREAFLRESASGPGATADHDEDGREYRLAKTPVSSVSQIHISSHFEEESENVSRSENDMGGLSSKAGIILGIHNIFIVIPQFLVTGISAVVFAIFEPNKTIHSVHHAGDIVNAPTNGSIVGESSTPLDASKSNSVAYILRFGGFAATVAWILCWRLTRELKHRGL